jgi:hypothetical protein
LITNAECDINPNVKEYIQSHLQKKLCKFAEAIIIFIFLQNPATPQQVPTLNKKLKGHTATKLHVEISLTAFRLFSLHSGVNVLHIFLPKFFSASNWLQFRFEVKISQTTRPICLHV